MSRHRQRAVCWLIVVATLGITCGALSGRARADGAFPDSFQILLPADRPQQIGLSTDFGLILSEDAGGTWTWTCEQPASSGAYLYSVSAPPLDRIFAVAPTGLVHSDDGGCSWTVAAGLPVGRSVVDAFPDPTDAQRIWTIVSLPGSATMPDQVFLSSDAGDSLGAPVFTAPAGAILTGVENARADPQTVYVAMLTPNVAADSAPQIPALARSTDGGATWSTIDAGTAAGTSELRIMAIDAADAQTIYLRAIGPFGEAVMLTRDGGATFSTPLSLDGGSITAFVRMPSGTLLVGGLMGTTAVGFRSVDRGATFVDWPEVPFLRDLAERGGQLFAASDNLYENDWAVGESSDEGATFQPLLAFGQVRGVRACAQATCAQTCESEVSAFVWPSSVCSRDIDAGTPPEEAGPGDTTSDGATAEAAAEEARSGGGCSCMTATSRDGRASVAVPWVLVLCLIRRSARPPKKSRRVR
jgi:photosystem II stability/assembly factor-like uncharacterized protein